MRVGDIIIATDKAQREYSLNGHKFFRIKQQSDVVTEIVAVYDDGVKLIGTINLSLFESIDMIDSVNDVLIMLLSRQKEIDSIEVTTKCGRSITLK